MNSENQQYLIDYLNAGGSIYIESPDIGANHSDTPLFSMFDANYLGDGGSNEVTSLMGQPGTITENMMFTFNGGPDSHYSIDHLSPAAGILLFQSTDGVGRTIASDNRGYRTIISSTLFGCHSNAGGINTKAYLMEQYLSFLDLDYAVEGTLSGTITDELTLEPIQGVTVTAADYNCTTDSEGYFSMNIMEGVYELLCEHEDYEDLILEQNVVIIPNETTNLDLEMTPLSGTGPEQLPVITELQGNYPNPFNPVTNIKFSLAKSQQVTVSIYNITGQKIIQLIDENFTPGDHSILWNGSDQNGNPVASGIYFYRMKTEDGYQQTRKMILMK